MIRRKISENQRNHLLQIFLHMGKAEAEIMCVLYGVNRQYALNQAREMGFFKGHVYRGGGNIAFGVDHTDERWQWAIQRGAVLAP
jgi:hypothetical protein